MTLAVLLAPVVAQVEVMAQADECLNVGLSLWEPARGGVAGPMLE